MTVRLVAPLSPAGSEPTDAHQAGLLAGPALVARDRRARRHRQAHQEHRPIEIGAAAILESSGYQPGNIQLQLDDTT